MSLKSLLFEAFDSYETLYELTKRNRVKSDLFKIGDVMREMSGKDLETYSSRAAGSVAHILTNLDPSDADKMLEIVEMFVQGARDYLSDESEKLRIPASMLEMLRIVHDSLLESRFYDLEKWRSLMPTFSRAFELMYLNHGNKVDASVLVPSTLIHLLFTAVERSCKIADVKRLDAMKNAFSHIDIMHDDSEVLRDLILKCYMHPSIVTSNEGRRFLSSIFLLDLNFSAQIHTVIKQQIPTARVTILKSYGELYCKIWLESDGQFRLLVESMIQGLMHLSIFVESENLSNNLRKILFLLHSKRKFIGESVFSKLYSPFLWRTLKAPNSIVRYNATRLFLDIFPLQNGEVQNADADNHLQQQFDTIDSLLDDEDIKIRALAIDGVARIVANYWDSIPFETVKSLLGKVGLRAFDCSSSHVRVAAINSFSYLTSQQINSHPLMKSYLPKLSNLIHDKVEAVRLAMVNLLLVIRPIRNIHFYDIVKVDDLILRLENDSSQMHSKLTSLLLLSYLPLDKGASEVSRRVLALVKQSSLASSHFFEHVGEFFSAKSSLAVVVAIFNALAVALESENAAKKQKKRKVISESFLDINDTSVVGSLLTAIVQLLRSSKDDTNYVEELQCAQESLSSGSILKLVDFYSSGSSDCVAIRSLLLLVQSILPETSKDFIRNSMNRLLNLPDDSAESEFSTILECLLSRNQISQLIKVLIDRLNFDLQALDSNVLDNNSELPKLRNASCIRWLSYILENESHRSKLKDSEIKSLIGSLNLYKSVMERKFQLEEPIAEHADLLLLALELRCKMSLHFEVSDNNFPECLIDVLTECVCSISPVLCRTSKVLKVSKKKMTSSTNNIDIAQRVCFLVLKLTSDAIAMGLNAHAQFLCQLEKIVKCMCKLETCRSDLFEILSKILFQVAVHNFISEDIGSLLDFFLRECPLEFLNQNKIVTPFKNLLTHLSTKSKVEIDFISFMLEPLLDMRFREAGQISISKTNFEICHDIKEIPPVTLFVASLFIKCDKLEVLNSILLKHLSAVSRSNSPSKLDTFLSMIQFLLNCQLILTNLKLKEEKTHVLNFQIKSIFESVFKNCANLEDSCSDAYALYIFCTQFSDGTIEFQGFLNKAREVFV